MCWCIDTLILCDGMELFPAFARASGRVLRSLRPRFTLCLGLFTCEYLPCSCRTSLVARILTGLVLRTIPGTVCVCLRLYRRKKSTTSRNTSPEEWAGQRSSATFTPTAKWSRMRFQSDEARRSPASRAASARLRTAVLRPLPLEAIQFVLMLQGFVIGCKVL
jgi:hypothetical protein